MAWHTPADTQAVLQLMRDAVNASEDTLFFTADRKLAKIDVTAEDGKTSTIEKTGLSVTTHRNNGYRINIRFASRKEDIYSLWIEHPRPEVDVNRQAVMQGLQDIIDNTHRDKTLFTVNAQHIAQQMGLL
ncbi:hypothetical protein BV20DRAFT_970296 [Pilatotrama ljubarskyi]|nr:hypothetical protein BV20DRAFT_970296 [Pilatotrama ljubarskyi]